MCQAKPGERCAADTRSAALATVDRYQAEYPDGPPVDPVSAARARAEDNARDAVSQAEEVVSSVAAAELSKRSEEGVFRRRYDTMDEKLAAYQGELVHAVEQLDQDDNWNAYLDTMARFHRYSMQNQLLISLQRPDATRVAGFRAWNEFDRHVMAGEKGISILAPKTVRVADADDNGKPKLDEKGRPVKRTKIIGWTTATVFDIKQTDGKPLPELQTTLSEEPPAGFVGNLEGAIARSGYTVSYEDLPPGTGEGYTQGSSKRVVVDRRLPPGSRASVLAHELGHITAGHIERGGEYHTGDGGNRGAMEVEAEAISFVLCRNAGMKTPGQTSAAYVKGWAGTTRNADVVKESASTVATAVKSILSDPNWSHSTEE